MVKTILTVATVAALGFSTASMASGEDTYNNLGCAGCHGTNGSGGFAPELAGLEASYIVAQLEAFQDGSRVDGTMNAMAPMVEGMEQEVADFLAAQK
jgi:cytochrome c553